MSWRETSLGEVLSVRHGKSQRAVESPSGRYPVLATGGRIGWSRVPLYSKPSVLIGRKGTIDRPQYQDSPFWTVDTLFYTELTKSVDPRFIYYIFQTIDWRSMNEASGVPSLSSSRIENIGVKLPSLDEQIIIREALDDADNLIVTLERLITKKQAIKTGMMQQLLTGAKRLPGYSEPWDATKLGAIATMGSGGTPLSSVSRYYGGGIPWVSISDMTSRGKFITATDITLTAEGLAASSAKLYEANILLYAMYASLGECSIAVGRVASSQAILGIKPGPNADIEFLYYWLQQMKHRVKTLGQQGTQSNLNAGMVRDFDIYLPKLEEQRAIGELLSEVDAELELLERRLVKARSIKQGMMQQLLTGRTRLPVEAAA